MKETKNFHSNGKRLLSPKTDIVFQVLFGEIGSEEITKEFLKAILKENITKVDLSKNPVLRRMTPNDKMGILDVIVKIDDKITCNIEMQLAKRDDIIPRLLYYWSRAYMRNIHKNDDYNKLDRTIVILIAGFDVEGLEELSYYTKWQLIESENRKHILTDFMKVDIIELSKIYKKDVNKNDKLLDWIYFIDNPESEEVEKIMEENKGIKEAKNKLEEISNDEIMQRIADWREGAEHDKASIKLTAQNETKREIAKKMLKDKIEISIIEKYTGLSKEKIKRL